MSTTSFDYDDFGRDCMNAIRSNTWGVEALCPNRIQMMNIWTKEISDRHGQAKRSAWSLTAQNPIDKDHGSHLYLSKPLLFHKPHLTNPPLTNLPQHQFSPLRNNNVLLLFTSIQTSQNWWPSIELQNHRHPFRYLPSWRGPGMLDAPSDTHLP